MALQIGRLDVDQMLSEISSPQWAEWIAYFRLEPFGENRKDWRAALIASTVARYNSTKPNQIKIKDFIPNFDESEEQTLEQQIQIVRMLHGYDRESSDQNISVR